jgi:hypothetical protein
MALRANIAVLFSCAAEVYSVMYNCRCTPFFRRGEVKVLVSISILAESQFSVSKLQYCHILPEVLHVCDDQQEIILFWSEFEVRSAGIAPPAFPPPERSPHKEGKVKMSSELPLHYIHGNNR